MLVRPGNNEPSVANMVELIRSNSKRYVDISFTDDAGNPADISETMVGGAAVGELDLEITNLGGDVVYTESYWPPPIDPTSRRIGHPSVGHYGLTYGDRASESDTTGTYLANWHLRQNTTSENVYATQVLEVVSPRTLSLLPSLRFVVDKTIKPCLAAENCFLGYTDAQLIIGLQLGLCLLNEYQPTIVWQNLDYYDIAKHGHILIKAALYNLLTAQGLFAIDTDIPSFNDQGHSFVLVHFAGLEQVANRIRQDLDRLVPDMKRQYVMSGSLGMEISMSTAAYTLFSSSPYGSLVKNWFSNV